MTKTTLVLQEQVFDLAIEKAPIEAEHFCTCLYKLGVWVSLFAVFAIGNQCTRSGNFFSQFFLSYPPEISRELQPLPPKDLILR